MVLALASYILILHSLEQAQLLRSHSTTVRGQVRRYYELTPLGRLCYAEARQTSVTLVREMFLALEL